MRPVSARSRASTASTQRSRPTSAKRSGSRSRSRSRSPTKRATMSEPGFLYETGTLGSGFQTMSLSNGTRDVYAPQFSMRGVPPETFVRMVRKTFHRKPEVYKKFVKILSQVERADTDKLDLVKRVITLFDGYPHLIEGFNAFLPTEYSIEIQQDAVIIKVFDSFGTRTSHVETGHARGGDSLGWYETERSAENTDPNVAYVQQVKEMYADQPHKYRQFTDILRDFHGKQVDEIGTIHKIVTLFSQYPHLIVGFNAFLPLGFHVYLSNDGYDIEHPGDNEGERTIVRYKK